jgi:ERCC4-type nuclease
MFVMDSKQASTDKRFKQNLRDLLEGDGQTVVEEDLNTADIMFKGRDEEGKLNLSLGFELKKSPSDLLSSLRDGRLVNQLSRGVQEYNLFWLMTIGTPIRVNYETGHLQERKRRSKGGYDGQSDKTNSGTFRWVDTKFTFHFLNSLLAKFEMAGGRVVHVEDMEKAAVTLLSYHSYWRKPDHTDEMFQKKRFKFSDWRMLENDLAQMYAIMVGPQRALTLAEHYPDLEMLCLASREDMISKKGIGGKTWQKVRKFVRNMEER